MSVPFAIRCPKCKTKLTIKKEALIGKKAPCPKCKATLVIQPPAPKPVAPAAAPVVAPTDVPDAGLSKPLDDPTAPKAPAKTPPNIEAAKMPVKPVKASAPKKKKPVKASAKAPVDDLDDFDEEDDAGFAGFGDDFDDDFDDEDDFEGETPQTKKGSAAAKARGKSKPTKAKSKGADKKKSGSKGLIVAVSVLGLALAGGAAWWLWPTGGSNDTIANNNGTDSSATDSASHDADSDHDSEDGRHGAPGNPVDPAATAVTSTEPDPVTSGGFDPTSFENQAFSSTASTTPAGAATFDVSHLPLTSEIFIRVDVAAIYNAAPIQMLIQNPAIGQNIDKMKDELGIGITDVKTVTVGIPNAQAIASQINPMMLMGGPMGMGPGGGPGGPDGLTGGPPPGNGFGEMGEPPADGGFGEMGSDDGFPADGGGFGPGGGGGPGQEPGIVVIRLATAIDYRKIQSVEPKFVDSSHAGTSYVRMEGERPAAIWLPNETTVVTGPDDFVKASINQGSAVPTANLSFVNPDANILISFAPQNPDSVFRADPTITSAAPPPVKPVLDNLVSQTDAVSIGIDLDSDLGLVASILCKTPDGAAKMEQGFGQLVPMAKGLLQQQMASAPAMQIGYMKMGESLLDSIQLSHEGHAFHLAGKSANAGQVLANQASIMIPTLLPAVTQARGAARRIQSKNNLKHLALAMLNSHDIHNRFPDLANTDSDSGKQLLSWRVHLLPLLEQKDLYEKFHLNEAWDSPHNKALLANMPDVFASPSANLEGGLTTYLAVTGPGTIFENGKGKSLRDIPDGSSNTLLVVEVNADAAVPWTRPDDFTPGESDIWTGIDAVYEDGFQAGLSDGSVRFFAKQIAPEVLKAMFTCAGGEVIPD